MIRHVGGIIALVWLAGAVPFLLVASESIDDATAEIEAGRLQLAQLTAAQADRVMTEAFYEIELMATAVATNGGVEPGSSADASDTRSVYGHHATFSSGVMYLDDKGAIVLSEPSWSDDWPEIGPAAEAIKSAAEAHGRSVSRPFLEPFTGDIVTALSLPVLSDDGSRIGTMIGLLDMGDPLIGELIAPARRLGATGHADLLHDDGVVLASTAPELVLDTGVHPEFNAQMGSERMGTVKRVRHEPNAVSQSEWHLMAYAPLHQAPWGIALGADENETLRSVINLRHRLIAVGIAAAVTFAVALVLTARTITALWPHTESA